MSVKRKVVDKRLTLFRTCGICGKSFVTTADTPWGSAALPTGETSRMRL